MKYRIKVVRYPSGMIEFSPQVKVCLFWMNIDYTGLHGISDRFSYKSRFKDDALQIINNHKRDYERKCSIKYKKIKGEGG